MYENEPRGMESKLSTRTTIISELARQDEVINILLDRLSLLEGKLQPVSFQVPVRIDAEQVAGESISSVVDNITKNNYGISHAISKIEMITNNLTI